MSTQQRLEGPDLEELLAKVRSDFGEAATIVEANRLRKGGVGGFFSKESFEVVVDVDEEARLAPRPSAPGGEDEEEPFVPFTLDDLVGRVDDPIPTFNSLLDAAVEQQPHMEDVTPASPAAPQAEPEPVEAAWPAQAAIDDVVPVVAASPKVARLVAGGLDGVPAPVAPAPFAPPAPAAPAAVATAVDEPAAVPASTPELDALAALGVPVDRLALPYRTDEPAAVALVRLLERLPAPPPMPRSQGAIVAVVGDRAKAVQVAELLGVGSEVVVASPRRGADVRTVEDADDRRRAWRRRKQPTVVVVEAPFGIAGDPWAAEMLDALEPVVALGHVAAGRKPEDVRRWAEQLGGLDALAVDGIDETTTPAAVLSVGLPVALLEGDVATPARWAAVLTDRMTALAAA